MGFEAGKNEHDILNIKHETLNMKTRKNYHTGPRKRRLINSRVAREMLLAEAARWGATRTRVPRGALAALEEAAVKLVAIHAAQVEPAKGAVMED